MEDSPFVYQFDVLQLGNMLRLYDSYTKRKEAFRPLQGKTVKMYNCGPTVYDFGHIGNLRSFLFSDVLRRYLEYRKYKVKQIMNITDVGHMVNDADAGEDKMSVAMRREGKGPEEVARFYEGKFFEDIRALSIRPAFKYPRATEHVPEMIKIVKKLLKRGHAYFVPEQGGGNSVYYDLSTFSSYGKLSGNKVEDLIAGARVEVAQGKRHPYDFALWIYKPAHMLKWPTPWGAGYPGWHLECSAMSMKYLGETLDIHTGGEDNKFPHHECEIAQSEGATGKQFSRFWLHAKHLLVDGKKMSKSLGNFYTLRDLMGKGYSAREIRYVLISTHYREQLNFTLQSLDAAKSALGRVDEFVEKLHNPPQPSLTLREGAKRVLPLRVRGSERGLRALVARARRDFIAAMDDDLNVSKALSILFGFVREVNREVSGASSQVSVLERKEITKLLQEFDEVLGLGIGARKKTAIPAEITMLGQKREEARKNKDWKLADELRQTIKDRGFEIEDTSNGPRVKDTASS